eukprot:CAMPEP_0197584942 /NCGR_PEP_ID=MMETSP1326-20131121/7401_1 /TAXON_ID=1155430 /ORGANISM="Genus nov. species nov., Strain RCC2288" /LENGTH=349 /DNA_ID=CAMNT_0043149381 /DNA_START=243 /DNA_END=1288 /DNA_ORIENTATION=+
MTLFAPAVASNAADAAAPPSRSSNGSNTPAAAPPMAPTASSASSASSSPVTTAPFSEGTPPRSRRNSSLSRRNSLSLQEELHLSPRGTPPLSRRNSGAPAAFSTAPAPTPAASAAGAEAPSLLLNSAQLAAELAAASAASTSGRLEMTSTNAKDALARNNKFRSASVKIKLGAKAMRAIRREDLKREEEAAAAEVAEVMRRRLRLALLFETGGRLAKRRRVASLLAKALVKRAVDKLPVAETVSEWRAVLRTTRHEAMHHDVDATREDREDAARRMWRYSADPVAKEAFDDERTLEVVMRLLLGVDREKLIIRGGNGNPSAAGAGASMRDRSPSLVSLMLPAGDGGAGG